MAENKAITFHFWRFGFDIGWFGNAQFVLFGGELFGHYTELGRNTLTIFDIQIIKFGAIFYFE